MLLDFLHIEEKCECLHLLLRVEVQRQLHHERPLSRFGGCQLVVEADRQVDEDVLVVLLELVVVAVQFSQDLEEAMSVGALLFAVLWRLDVQVSHILRALEFAILDELGDQRAEGRILHSDEDGPLTFDQRLFVVGDLLRIGEAVEVKSDLDLDWKLPLVRQFHPHRLLNLGLVLDRELPLAVLEVVLVDVSVVVLALEELWHVRAADRTRVTVVEVLLHALDAEAMPAGQNAGLDH